MNGRIKRPDEGEALGLPVVGKLHIGIKSEKGYPQSIDWFRADSQKYGERFHQVHGEKPNTVVIVFPDDDPAKVCCERYAYYDNDGRLFARGDGEVFEVWDGKKYVPYSVEQYPDIMNQVEKNNPNRKVKSGQSGWDVELNMRFIIPALGSVLGCWSFSTKGGASTIPNVRKSFDAVKRMRGTVTTSVFDLSVKFAKSNKPGQQSRFPVVELVANDNRLEEIRAMLERKQSLSLLLPESKN